MATRRLGGDTETDTRLRVSVGGVGLGAAAPRAPHSTVVVGVCGNRELAAGLFPSRESRETCLCVYSNSEMAAAVRDPDELIVSLGSRCLLGAGIVRGLARSDQIEAL